jgi:hypothetical protein
VLGDGLLVGLGLVVGLLVGLGLLLGLGPLLVGLGDGLLGLGSGLELIVGVGVGVLVGLGLLLLGLGDGLWLSFGLGDSAPPVLDVRLPAAVPLPPRDCLADLFRLALCAADSEISDADIASAVAPLCPALSAAATPAAVAGRVVQALLAADADVTCVPAKNTLTRPHETTAVPAHAPKVAGPARRFLTVLTSPQSLPRQGLCSVASLITLCSPPKWAFPSVLIRHL